MFLTETEAAARWCPAEGGDSCLGSQCMAWRWGEPLRCRLYTATDVETDDVLPIRSPEPRRPRDVPGSWTWHAGDLANGDPPSWNEPQAEAVARRRGYCGLAGAPDPES